MAGLKDLMSQVADLRNGRAWNVNVGEFLRHTGYWILGIASAGAALKARLAQTLSGKLANVVVGNAAKPAIGQAVSEAGVVTSVAAMAADEMADDSDLRSPDQLLDEAERDAYRVLRELDDLYGEYRELNCEVVLGRSIHNL